MCSCPGHSTATHRHWASHQHHWHHRAVGSTTVPPLSFGQDGNLRDAGHCQGTGPALPGTALPAHCLLMEAALTSTLKAPWYPHIHSSAPLSISPSHLRYPPAPHTDYQQYNSLHPTHNPISPPSPIPSPFEVFKWGLSPGWARMQQAGSWPCWGAEQGGGGSPRGVNMGTKEKTLPTAWWGRLQGQETPKPGDTSTLAAYPGQEEEALRGAAASTLGMSPSSLSKVSWRCRG